MAAFTPYRSNLSKEEAPQHNLMPYVIRGYCSGGDYKRCLLSAFELHAQTLNAWTMALNGLISICMFAAVAATMVPPTSALVPFAALTAAVLVHAPFSVGNHLFSCMGAEVHSLWQRLDQMFILVAAVLSTFGLSWHVYSGWVAIAVNTGLTSGIAAQGIRQGRCVKRQRRWHRVQMLMLVRSIGLATALPIMVQVCHEVYAQKMTAASAYGLTAFASYQLGRWIFAHSFPERLYPGVFDLVGHSHQLMHLLIIVSCVMMYMFVWELHKQQLHVMQ